MLNAAALLNGFGPFGGKFHGGSLKSSAQSMG